jgi:hypothetical protein
MEEAHIGSAIRLTQVLTMRDLSKLEQVQSSNFSPQITGDKNIAQKELTKLLRSHTVPKEEYRHNQLTKKGN